ncbi:MerR family DNA-binding protein [Acinetobacter haemolyticus]|uniref:MerR family DNA-binding protein n=1 Tax=Acinetobacter haemolyticus TaxID=29430 RepID=UPI0026BB39DC|nr:MerR family DNA-binding protein [Acinetobacter haemolyticus]
MLIGELAKQAQLSRDTIRFYEKIKLIQSITRNNGYKDYPEQTLQQLQLIRTAKHLGFSLSEIQQILQMTEQNEIPAPQVQNIFQEKLNMIDEKIAQLNQIKNIEPYRVCRRVNILRDYPDDKTKLYPRN